MKIKGTEWYTACAVKLVKKGNSAKVEGKYGYRLPVEGRSPEEIKEMQNLLKADGVSSSLKTSMKDHTGIPAGTVFIEVLDEKSATALEGIFLKQGIDLPADRYKEYGLEIINRPGRKVDLELDFGIKKSFLDRLLGRK